MASRWRRDSRCVAMALRAVPSPRSAPRRDGAYRHATSDVPARLRSASRRRFAPPLRSRGAPRRRFAPPTGRDPGHDASALRAAHMPARRRDGASSHVLARLRSASRWRSAPPLRSRGATTALRAADAPRSGSRRDGAARLPTSVLLVESRWRFTPHRVHAPHGDASLRGLFGVTTASRRRFAPPWRSRVATTALRAADRPHSRSRRDGASRRPASLRLAESRWRFATHRVRAWRGDTAALRAASRPRAAASRRRFTPPLRPRGLALRAAPRSCAVFSPRPRSAS